MNLRAEDLDKLYERYGFERKLERPNVRVYALRQGHFHNADVVPLEVGVDAKKIAEEFQRSGFACRIREYNSILNADEELFNGFFAVPSTSRRLLDEVERFRNSQSKVLGGNYEYIPCPYTSSDDPLGDENIVSAVLSALSHSGPRLVLIEAGAGMGKTCTAYEVLRAFLNRDPKPLNPVFTELSRNRQARVFKYVLLDEIDRNYSSLKLDLVLSEIQAGRLPLIVDGFDELLYRSGDFEVAETMLDTIGSLLTREAKIILTSRKTAIFAGDDFHRWIEDRSQDFTVTRFTLGEPSVEDWLGAERVERLEQAGLPLAGIANPVLLTFLRNLTPDKFIECCSDSEIIVEQYFKSLLEREQVRQALTIAADDQMTIFRALAKSMMDLDFTAESRDFLRDCILESSRPILLTARRSYSIAERPTVEQLADILAGHALLDRVGRNENAVGFVNEFVLGTLQGEVISEDSSLTWIGSEEVIDRSITAFSVRSEERRKSLWEKFQYSMQAVDPSMQMSVDIKLCRGPARDYQDSTFEGMTFKGIRFGGDFVMDGSVFSGCTFRDCIFELDRLSRVGFLACKFFNCRVVGLTSGSASGECWVVNSTADGGSEYGLTFLASLKEINTGTLLASGSAQRDYQLEVLQQFWPRGRPNATVNKLVRTLFLGFSANEQGQVADAIEGLRRDRLIDVSGRYAELNVDEMPAIRVRLGREG